MDVTNPIRLKKSQSKIVKRAIISASNHGINLCQGRLNPAKGNCAFEAPIFNNNDRPCFSEKFSLSMDHYRAKWIAKGENVFFHSDFNPGYSLAEWKAGFSQLKKSNVYEVDFFGDLVIPSIAVGMRKILLIFNTNTDTLREPVTLINPAQYGVIPTSEYPLVLAYNISHYESMHPMTDADDMKCIELVSQITSGQYPYSYRDLPRLVGLNTVPYVYQENSKDEIIDLPHEKSKSIEMSSILHSKRNREKCKELIEPDKFKKKIKDMTIEERRTYNREKYRERKERLRNDELEKLQNAWKENKSNSRNKLRNNDEVSFKATMANEKCQERAKKRIVNDKSFKTNMASEKKRERTKKR